VPDTFKSFKCRFIEDIVRIRRSPSHNNSQKSRLRISSLVRSLNTFTLNMTWNQCAAIKIWIPWILSLFSFESYSQYSMIQIKSRVCFAYYSAKHMGIWFDATQWSGEYLCTNDTCVTILENHTSRAYREKKIAIHLTRNWFITHTYIILFFYKDRLLFVFSLIYNPILYLTRLKNTVQRK